MSSTNGASRVAAINNQIATTGGVAPSAQNNSSPSQISNAITTAITNPKDVVGYQPTAQPGKDLSGAPIGTTPSATTPTTGQPTGTQTPPTAPTTLPNGTQTGLQTPTTPEPLTGTESQQATQAIDQLKAKYGKALTDITGTGVQAPANQGSATAGIQSALNTQPPPPGPTTTANVDNFFNPEANPDLQQSTQNIIDFLSPPNTRNELTAQMGKILADQNAVASAKLELMNVKNVMSGTADDLRKEIEASGGIATESLVQSLAVSRNSTLLKQASFLQDQLAYQQDLVANDTTLLNFEKDMANTQATQRMGILQYQQKNYSDMMNASRESYKTLMENNPQGLYDSLVANSAQGANFSKITGLPVDSLKGFISTKAIENQKNQLQIQGLKLDNQKKVQDLTSTTGDKNQQKLETDYKNTLLKELSNRSGGLGLQDAKVNQAIHLKALLDQYKDPTTGIYSVPKAQYAEIAMGMANLVSGSNVASDSAREEITQKTAKGDINGALTYILGTPFSGSTDAVFKNLADSIDRQGKVSEDLRNQYVQTLHGFVPTDLQQSRVDALEKNTLPSYTNYGKSNNTQTPMQRLLGVTEIPSGYYQASDGLLYKK